jgi:hypothetical protein
MTNEELAKHADALWQLFFEYVQKHAIECSTTGIVLLSEFDPTGGKPQERCALAIRYAGDGKRAAMTMTRAAMAELQRAGVNLPGRGVSQ